MKEKPPFNTTQVLIVEHYLITVDRTKILPLLTTIDTKEELVPQWLLYSTMGYMKPFCIQAKDKIRILTFFLLFERRNRECAHILVKVTIYSCGGI